MINTDPLGINALLASDVASRAEEQVAAAAYVRRVLDDPDDVLAALGLDA